MADTSQNARALRPTKRTDVKGRSTAPDADASVRGQEETETHTSARGAARVAARKAAREAQAQSEREQKAAAKAAAKAQKAAEKDAKKAEKAAEKGSRNFKFWQKKDGGAAAGATGAAEADPAGTGDTTAISAAALATKRAAAGRSEADARALRFATAGGRGDLSSSHADPTVGDDAEAGAARGSSRRHAAADEKTFDFTGAANSIGDFCRRHLVVVVTIVAIVFVVAAIYEPARTYYVAWRTGSALQTSYDSLSQSNEDLQSEVERLQSKEGIEDEARKKGYVNPGETAVNVEGLPDDSAGDQTQEEDPWYIQLGDTIFGYSAS